MLRYLSIFGLSLAVSACTTGTNVPNSKLTPEQLAQTSIAISHTECQGSARTNCSFFNAPVQLQKTGIKFASRNATFFQTVSQLDFIDARATRWIAPKDTLTDGASIPNIFISLIGNPTNSEFLSASTMHDAYCGIGNENGARFHTDTWQNVHRMFYDALRVGGTAPNKAKIMFSAVYLGGPRWASPTAISPQSLSVMKFQNDLFRGFSANRSLGRVSTDQMIAQLKSAIKFINDNNPTLAELEIFLMKSEANATEENGENDGEHFANFDDSTTTLGNNPTTGNTNDPTIGTDPYAIPKQ